MKRERDVADFVAAMGWMPTGGERRSTAWRARAARSARQGLPSAGRWPDAGARRLGAFAVTPAGGRRYGEIRQVVRRHAAGAWSLRTPLCAARVRARAVEARTECVAVEDEECVVRLNSLARLIFLVRAWSSLILSRSITSTRSPLAECRTAKICDCAAALITSNTPGSASERAM